MARCSTTYRCARRENAKIIRRWLHKRSKRGTVSSLMEKDPTNAARRPRTSRKKSFIRRLLGG